jgi:hypothetical protein
MRTFSPSPVWSPPGRRNSLIYPSEHATTSAYVEEVVTRVWRSLCQSIGWSLTVTTQPLWERPVSEHELYAASVYKPMRKPLLGPKAPREKMSGASEPFTYKRVFLSSWKCSAWCLALNFPNTLSARRRSGCAERA